MLQKDIHEEGENISLLVCLTKDLFGTGSIIILDIILGVPKAILALKNHGFYASALMNKIRYCPKFINGKLIKLYMGDKEVITQAILPGQFGGIGFDILHERT